jgi:hypothetical protein
MKWTGSARRCSPRARLRWRRPRWLSLRISGTSVRAASRSRGGGTASCEPACAAVGEPAASLHIPDTDRESRDSRSYRNSLRVRGGCCTGWAVAEVTAVASVAARPREGGRLEGTRLPGDRQAGEEGSAPHCIPADEAGVRSDHHARHRLGRDGHHPDGQDHRRPLRPEHDPLRSPPKGLLRFSTFTGSLTADKTPCTGPRRSPLRRLHRRAAAAVPTARVLPAAQPRRVGVEEASSTTASAAPRPPARTSSKRRRRRTTPPASDAPHRAFSSTY